MKQRTGHRTAQLLLGLSLFGTMLFVEARARADTSGTTHRSVGASAANFRSGPCTSKPILFTADRYYPVRVLGCKNGWCKTRDFEGDVAWVAKRLLSPQPSVVVNVTQANVRTNASTSSEVLFRVDWGEALKVNHRKDDWLAIEDIAGDQGWIHAKLTWGFPEK